MNQKKHPLFYSDDQTCPWWMIGSFDNPRRHFIHRPEQILAGLAKEGQTVLDLGPGVGYFTLPLPLARTVGPDGLVIAADLQPQMLALLRRRAERAGLLERIQLHQAQPRQIGLATRGNYSARGERNPNLRCLWVRSTHKHLKFGDFSLPSELPSGRVFR